MSLLSTTQNFEKGRIIPTHVTHPFASSAEESCATLQELVNTTDLLANALSMHSSVPLSNPKLVSLLRQHSSISHTLHESDRNTRQIIDALQKRSGSSYGEDIPLNSTTTVDWYVSRLEAWGTSAGMETFKDDGRTGGISVVLGGKVLVIDVDFSVKNANLSQPTIGISSVKTSYAISNAASPSNSGPISLDSFLSNCIEQFCMEVQKPEEVRNPQEAARLGVAILDQLRYLVMLDRLAARKDMGGLRWFGCVDELCPLLEKFARSEGEAVALSLSLARAPLDIFLLRSHALPLPYLISPSISFLVYITPLSYLSLLRTTPDAPLPLSDGHPSNLDITTSSVRSYLSSHPEGVVVATLSLSEMWAGHIFPVSMPMPNFTPRPTFPLASPGSELEYVFPQIADLVTTMTSFESESSGDQYTWYLDFTDGGRSPGVVMSRSRMRDIELIVNPLVGIDTLNSVEVTSFGIGSWVNLLLSPEENGYPMRYTALYISPASLHPPLQLRLAAPEEPGFRLEQVPVHNMKEAWGVLEVVREQCWLNEIIASCQWAAEGPTGRASDLQKESEATEEELQAVLSGNLTPKKLPVNVFLPSHSDALFPSSDLGSMSITQRPKIVMTSPERPPFSGLVEITVAYDETRPRGVAVDVSGAMGADIKLEVLEEISRRGGTLGLSGRVWSKAHGS